MTTRRDPWSDQAAETRSALCDAALRLLVDSGIAAFDVGHVDRTADLPSGTCEQYFHSQGELLAALLERTAALYHDKLQEFVARHPGDQVACIIDWLGFVVGPARDHTRVAWALLLDPGTRAQVTMYADALQAAWERRVADSLGLPVAQVRVAWAMVEGWIGRNLMHELPLPTTEALATHVRALLRAHDEDLGGTHSGDGAGTNSATVGW